MKALPKLSTIVFVIVCGLLITVGLLIREDEPQQTATTETTIDVATSRPGTSLRTTTTENVGTPSTSSGVPTTEQQADLQDRAAAFVEAYNFIEPNDGEATCKDRVQQYMYQGETPQGEQPFINLVCPVSPGTEAEENREEQQLTTNAVVQTEGLVDHIGPADDDPSVMFVSLPVVITTTDPNGLVTSGPVRLLTETQWVQQGGQWVVIAFEQGGSG